MFVPRAPRSFKLLQVGDQQLDETHGYLPLSHVYLHESLDERLKVLLVVIIINVLASL